MRGPRSPRAPPAPIEATAGSAENVVAFPGRACGSPFDELTVELLLAKFRNGTLPEGIFRALLTAVELP